MATLISASRTNDSQPIAIARASALPGGVSARVLEGLDAFELARERMGSDAVSTVFQSSDWLSAWYATIGRQESVEPLFVEVSGRDLGKPLLLLPMVRRRMGGLSVVEMADLGVTDYNGPVLSRQLATLDVDSRALLAAIRSVLPRADLLNFEKMPVEIGGVPNPLAKVNTATPCHLFGSVIVLEDGWDAYVQSRGKKFRKETKRCMNHIARFGEVTFKLLSDTAEIEKSFAALEAQQRERMIGLGMGYRLDDPNVRAFYTRLLDADRDQNFVRIYALSVDDVRIGIVFCIAHLDALYLLRIAHAQGKWQPFGPGRLAVINTMMMGASEGYRRCDMTIGDYAFKRSFRPERYDLVDLVMPLSWRGLPRAARARLRPVVRRWRDRRTSNDAASTAEDNGTD